MNRFEIIEKLIEKATGRLVNGEAIWNELEFAVGQYTGEDGTVTLTGEDNLKECWEYEIELKRIYDEEADEWSTDFTLLEITIKDKKSQNFERIKIQGATL